MSKALVVLSGGQDSTTVLFAARQAHSELHAVTFDYNQRHKVEIEAARRVATLASVTSHEIVQLGPILHGRSPLTNPAEELERYPDHDTMEKVIGDRVELTFVPMRNALFLTLAANRAVCKDIEYIFTGVCQADNANYPDCRQIFIDQQQHAINYALGRGPMDDDNRNRLCICTPLMDMTKAVSVRYALSMRGCYTALGFSHTAYDGAFPPTNDHASVLRAHGFEQANVPDPLIVRAVWEGRLATYPDTNNYRHWSACLEETEPFSVVVQADPFAAVRAGLAALEDLIRAN
jgi:7-cyano-7-deazaguanine synthase